MMTAFPGELKHPSRPHSWEPGAPTTKRVPWLSDSNEARECPSQSKEEEPSPTLEKEGEEGEGERRPISPNKTRPVICSVDQ